MSKTLNSKELRAIVGYITEQVIIDVKDEPEAELYREYLTNKTLPVVALLSWMEGYSDMNLKISMIKGELLVKELI